MLQKHEEKAIVELQSEHQNKIGIVTCDYEGKVNQLKREITEVTTSRDSLQKEASLK